MKRSSDAREAVLGSVRSALAGGQRGSADSIPREYRGQRHVEALPELFRERVAEYRAAVHTTDSTEAPETVLGVLERADARRVVVPEGLPAQWSDPVAEHHDTLGDRPRLSTTTLENADAVLTTCTVGIATTGTIVLDHGPGQGRRALTLLPDTHVCLVAASRIVDDVPAALAELDPAGPMTFISGPSATSDIELERVEGVHGPRDLHVVIVGDV
ncbi:L-lactate dehydrogenase complex protein LldG [Actinopolyspora lacussalsi]|uniref:L-lactate dehydrogenase complex protein LldG n=1 Tax=Actinopolyspora righensis TaxID=995060 RepID=A0A1I6X7G5_9ACTN|nr:lactate utilization protein C [Actinopolyspora righensis]MDP9641206.1 L-lactate dehydrogenase complex protein LldG [Actinopolyspora lacussalsi]SFT34103.1 L-lactate dehydrogenase complex protein LldG [Actinopolyspora righensis]